MDLELWDCSFDGFITSIRANHGLSVRENGSGAVDVYADGCEFNNAEEQGVQVTGRGAGDVSVYLFECTVSECGFDGVKVDNPDSSDDIACTFTYCTITGNGYGDLEREHDGIQIADFDVGEPYTYEGYTTVALYGCIVEDNAKDGISADTSTEGGVVNIVSQGANDWMNYTPNGDADLDVSNGDGAAETGDFTLLGIAASNDIDVE